MAGRVQQIEISERANADVATGSVEASSHHIDEEGKSEIRVNDTTAAAGAPLNLDDIFDNVDYSEHPLLAMEADDVGMITSTRNTASGKTLRLKRGITMVAGAHHNVMLKRMTGTNV